MERRVTSSLKQDAGLPRGTRRDAVRQFKKHLIRDAAKQIFAERGIEAASMREIAQSAGYTTGSIYLYFDTKEELYAEVLRDTLHALYVVVAESPLPAGASQTERALRGLWQFFTDRPADFDLGFYLYGGARPAGLSPQLDDELNELLDSVMVHIAQCLVADGLTAQNDAHHQAVLHATWIFGLLLMNKTRRLKAFDERAEPLLDSYMHNVLSTAPNRPRSQDRRGRR
jgi:TetR/AcrR family transcriptional regulator